MKHKVSELDGELLNSAVALAEAEEHDGLVSYREFCTRWEDGGPIIEREFIDLEAYRPTAGSPSVEWGAYDRHRQEHPIYGPTPLIAAMRAYVASKFGDEVELP